MKHSEIISAYIDGKIMTVKVINWHYAADSIEGILQDGNCKGFGVIVRKSDIIPKKTAKSEMEKVVIAKKYAYSVYAKDGLIAFYRADYNGQTIATMCRTKKECEQEAKRYLKSILNQ